VAYAGISSLLDVRRDPALPARGDEVSDVVARVPAKRHALVNGHRFVEHGERRVALRKAGRLLNAQIDDNRLRRAGLRTRSQTRAPVDTAPPHP
jgi:hypothetical protein